MIRAFIDYLGDDIELPRGETVIGRDLSCQIRLNDPAVSRRHLRFIVSEDAVVVEDLRSINGTRINGRPLEGAWTLADGDEVQLGGRTLRVRLVARSDAFTSVTDTSTGLAPGAETDHGHGRRAAVPLPPELRPPEIARHHCPRCRASVPIATDRCPHCSYDWPQGRPSSVTVLPEAPDGAPPDVSAQDRRGATRHVTDVAVVYSSETLTFEAAARDLSRGGVYVATELLDAVGTPCRVTILPDGAPAFSLTAVVRHVVESKSARGVPPGLGLQFGPMSTEAARWLDNLLLRLTPPPP